MITNNIKHFLFAGLVSCGIAAAFTACSDTWDEHYEGTVADVTQTSLWEAIKQNPNLSNFASVVEATGYDKSLGSSQVFTVFAPLNANFSKEQADALIAEFKQQKQKVNDEDNTVIKEFIQNHIALYNYSVSENSNDSIVLMNGKFALLQAGKISNSSFESTNKVYQNGVLYTLNSTVNYADNVFEYMRKDADLDSAYQFFYNSLFYRKEFLPELSVEGGIDDEGRTIYLDSVFRQRNNLDNVVGRIGSEDSTYWMVVPTNEVWADLLQKYEPYFHYDKNVGSLLVEGTRDSLIYTNPRLAIMRGTAFSRTINEGYFSGTKTGLTINDSIYSFNALTSYNNRTLAYGAPFNYYQYFAPMAANGVLNESDKVECSNGRLMKVRNWKLNELQTFNQWVVVEAESSGSIKEIKKMVDSKGDSINMANAISLPVNIDKFRQKVWNNRFVEFEPNGTNVNPEITFNISNVLSNMGYDIYLVSAPALANDSNATDKQSLPTSIQVELSYHNEDGTTVKERLQSKVDVRGDIMDYVLLAEDFKFPVCTWGVREVEPITTMTIKNRVTATQVKNGTYTKTMRVDCLLLVPHGTLELTEALPEDSSIPQSYWGTPGVLMYPHGKDGIHWYYMPR